MRQGCCVQTSFSVVGGLHTLRSPLSKSHKGVDLLAVDGLQLKVAGGRKDSYLRTWIHDATGHCWLTDSLPWDVASGPCRPEDVNIFSATLGSGAWDVGNMSTLSMMSMTLLQSCRPLGPLAV